MASQINTPTTLLPSVLPSGIGGNAADYQAKIMGGAQRRGAQRKGAQRKGTQKQRGGQGYGYEGKEITPGKMEFSSYKGGSKKRRHSKKRRQQRKSKRQQKSRRR